MPSKFQTELRSINVSVCTPAFRTFWIYVEILSDGYVINRIYPVLALQSQIVDEYVRRRDEYDPCYSTPPHTPESAEDEGWSFQHRHIEQSGIVVDEEYNLISTSDSLLSGGGVSRSEFVVLPWPYDDARDAGQLGKVRLRLTEEAKKSFAKKEEIKKAAGPAKTGGG